jgi:hypothetical protein
MISDCEDGGNPGCCVVFLDGMRHLQGMDAVPTQCPCRKDLHDVANGSETCPIDATFPHNLPLANTQLTCSSRHPHIIKTHNWTTPQAHLPTITARWSTQCRGLVVPRLPVRLHQALRYLHQEWYTLRKATLGDRLPDTSSRPLVVWWHGRVVDKPRYLAEETAR